MLSMLSYGYMLKAVAMMQGRLAVSQCQSESETMSCCCSSAAVAVVGCGLRCGPPEQDNLISFSSANEKLLAQGLVGS